MTTEAWTVEDPQGHLVTYYWFQGWAEDYVDEHPGEGLSIRRVDIHD